MQHNDVLRAGCNESGSNVVRLHKHSRGEGEEGNWATTPTIESNTNQQKEEEHVLPFVFVVPAATTETSSLMRRRLLCPVGGDGQHHCLMCGGENAEETHLTHVFCDAFSLSKTIAYAIPFPLIFHLQPQGLEGTTHQPYECARPLDAP